MENLSEDLDLFGLAATVNRTILSKKDTLIMWSRYFTDAEVVATAANIMNNGEI